MTTYIKPPVNYEEISYDGAFNRVATGVWNLDDFGAWYFAHKEMIADEAAYSAEHGPQGDD